MSTIQPESLADVYANVKTAYAEYFKAEPQFLASAPGRVNIIGEHIDYNGGMVLPAAIECGMGAAFSPNGNSLVRIWDARYQSLAEIDFSKPMAPEKGSWENYIKGVLAELKVAGVAVKGFDACIYSTIPMGGGLSSSAALEALIATINEAVTGRTLDPVDKSVICQRAEHNYAGVPCGIMDQMAVICSKADHLLLINCKDNSSELVPFTNPNLGILVIDSKVHHSLADGAYKQRRDGCEKIASMFNVDTLGDLTMDQYEALLPKVPVELQPLFRHVMTEIDRTARAVELLRKGNYVAFGKLLEQSHESLRRDYKVSCDELDFIVDTLQPLDGVYGCRMTGGGFGGSTIALVEKSKAESIAAIIRKVYSEKFGQEPGVFLTSPMNGASYQAL
ncbi:MAG: galactokinase [Opitutales bacterium]|nr:galactokinase [Opitutales bacterium]